MLSLPTSTIISHEVRYTRGGLIGGHFARGVIATLSLCASCRCIVGESRLPTSSPANRSLTAPDRTLLGTASGFPALRLHLKTLPGGNRKVATKAMCEKSLLKSGKKTRLGQPKHHSLRQRRYGLRCDGCIVATSSPPQHHLCFDGRVNAMPPTYRSIQKLRNDKSTDRFVANEKLKSAEVVTLTAPSID